MPLLIATLFASWSGVFVDALQFGLLAQRAYRQNDPQHQREILQEIPKVIRLGLAWYKPDATVSVH